MQAYRIGLVIAVVCCLLPGPGQATTWPIDPALIRAHFSTRQQAQRLRGELEHLKARLAALDRRAMRFPGVKALIPFTFRRSPFRFTKAQLREAREKGWVEARRFGWRGLTRQLDQRLPARLDALEQRIRRLERRGGSRPMPPWIVAGLNRARQKLSDALGIQQAFLQRLESWDRWCRKGPWLIEDAPKKRLRAEITGLNAYLHGEAFPERLFPSLAALDERQRRARARLNLAEKRRVYDWFYAFRKPDDVGKRLERGEDGYVFRLCYQLEGPGADAAFARRLAHAVEHYWRGEVDGMQFRSRVTVTLLGGGEKERPDCMAVHVGGEDEVVWPSQSALPADVDEATIAHEMGHGFGFPDRYRDIYDFNRREYRTMLWQPESLMSAPNGLHPKVGAADLRLLIEHYLLHESPRPEGGRP